MPLRIAAVYPRRMFACLPAFQGVILWSCRRSRRNGPRKCSGPSSQDVEFDYRTLVQPDLFVVPLINGRKPRTREAAGQLLLAIETLSPGTARLDRSVKRQLYQRQRFPEYWIVDMDARLVERWKPDDERPEIITGLIQWKAAVTPDKLEIDLPALFAAALD